MICLALTAASLDENRSALEHYKAHIDIAEIRADKLAIPQLEFLANWLDLQKKQLGISFVLTCRLPADGGAWVSNETERRAFMLRVVETVRPETISYIDLEQSLSWPEVEAAAAKKGIREIRSFHDFIATPDDLYERMQAILRLRPRTDAGPVVPKAAVMTASSRDLLTVVRAATALGKNEAPFILVGMGSFGVATRILAPLWGALLTYTSASLPGHSIAAPGHMDPATLAELYGYKNVNRRTVVFGIAGKPVAHSKSPAFHNPKLRAAGLNACYVPFLVDDMQAFLSLAEHIDLRACSVTVPHKERALALASRASESAKLIGASNTLVREKDGWFATNTDAPGFYEPLEAVFAGRSTRGLKALVLGAGGAARGIVVALLEHGFELLILNRSVERAEKLAAEMNAVFGGRVTYARLPQRPSPNEATGEGSDDLSEIRGRCAPYGDLIVQTSSMGMEGELEAEDPLWFHEFSGEEIVYDIVYTPPRTPMLARAEAAGCRVINGEGMFVQQALLQLDLFVKAAQ